MPEQKGGVFSALRGRAAGAKSRFANATVSIQEARDGAWRVAGHHVVPYLTTKLRVIVWGLALVAVGTEVADRMTPGGASTLESTGYTLAGLACSVAVLLTSIYVFAFLYIPFKQRNALRAEAITTAPKNAFGPEVAELIELLADGQALLARIGDGPAWFGGDPLFEAEEKDWRGKVSSLLNRWPRELRRFMNASAFGLFFSANNQFRESLRARVEILEAIVSRLSMAAR